MPVRIKPWRFNPLEFEECQRYLCGGRIDRVLVPRQIPELDKFVDRICHLSGSYLVTGYRGVGKTSFVNYALATACQRLQENDPPGVIIPVFVNLARSYEIEKLLRRTVRKLYRAIVETRIELPRKDGKESESSLYSVLPGDLQARLDAAYLKTSAKVSQAATEALKTVIAEATTRELNLGIEETGEATVLPDPLPAKVGLKLTGGYTRAKTTSKSEEKARENTQSLEYLEYDDEIAEAELMQLIADLVETPIEIRWQEVRTISRKLPWIWQLWGTLRGQDYLHKTVEYTETRRLHLVMVFDELDKLTLDQAQKMLRHLKEVMLTNQATFIFVGGWEIARQWLTRSQSESDLLYDLFADIIYVPLYSHEEVDSLVGHLTKSADTNETFEHALLDHLKLHCLGTPRRFFRQLLRFVSWEEGEPVLDEDGEAPYARVFPYVHRLNTEIPGTLRSEVKDDLRRRVYKWLTIAEREREFTSNDLYDPDTVAQEISPGRWQRSILEHFERFLSVMVEADVLRSTQGSLYTFNPEFSLGAWVLELASLDSHSRMEVTSAKRSTSLQGTEPEVEKDKRHSSVGRDETVTIVSGDSDVTMGLEIPRGGVGTYVPPEPPAPGVLPNPGELPPGSRVPFMRNALFTGREEALRELGNVLLHNRASDLVLAAVTGMGGIGKTQLAVEFVHRYGRFLDGVHWINATNSEAISAEVAACGRAMDLEPWPADQPRQVARTLRAWKASGPRLVVLDNLEDMSVARTWLARFSGGPIRLLLTTRRSGWPRDLGMRSLQLNPFTPEESLAYLRRHLSETRGEPGALITLGARLGHHPLALALAGRYLETQSQKGIEEYLGELDVVLEHPSMQRWQKELGSPTGHEFGLMSTFSLSWEWVTNDTTRRLFLLSGYCAANTPIPLGMLEQAEGIDTETCQTSLSVLANAGLVEEDLIGRPIIHPLAAEYAREMAKNEDRSEAVLVSLMSGLKTESRKALQTGLPADFAPMHPHILAVTSAAESESEEARTHAGALWNNLGIYLQSVADYARARECFERALEIAEAAHGPDHPEVATHIHNLGNLLHDQGDLAGAYASFAEALSIWQKAYGEEHPRVATGYNSLGNVQQVQGDLAGARTSYDQALRILDGAFGSEHPRVATLIHNIAEVLRQQGDVAAARRNFERALGIDEAALGPDHPTVARDINGLGLVQQAQGDLAAAQASFERALRIDEAVFGPQHPRVATDVNNLGSVLRENGDLSGAREAFERALAIDEAVYGPENPQVATRLNNLGSVLQDEGDLAGAREAFERALDIYRNAYGPDHPQVAATYNNLGLTLKHMGDLVEARGVLERALTIAESVYGSQHPRVAQSLNNLGAVLHDIGDLEEAHNCFERALSIDENLSGPSHPNVARDINNLGNTLRELGKLEEAREAFERARRIDESALGPEHPLVGIRLTNTALVLREQGNLEEARLHLHKALAIFERSLPSDHPYAESARKQLDRLEPDGRA